MKKPLQREIQARAVRWGLLMIVLLVAAAWVGLSHGFRGGAFQWKLGPMFEALLVFAVGTVLLFWGMHRWLERIDHHPLLRSDEKLQNKDALVISTFFTEVMLLGLCVTGAAAAGQFGRDAVVLALAWALASAAVGASFGFLLGHPRRFTSEETGKEQRTGVNALLRTGLDDMVDWLVKGLTTVLLVNSTMILKHLDDVSRVMAKGLQENRANAIPIDTAIAFAQPVIVFFTLFGALAACLVTRTYLTGALTRADRSTTGAFVTAGLDWGEALVLMDAQRFLTTRDSPPSHEVRRISEKLAALSIEDLRTAPEFALWAKAKSMLGQVEEALTGYEKAVAQCDCDPALLLDYAVALHAAGQSSAVLPRLEDAYEHLSDATPIDTRKNIYKSLTFQLLYQPEGFERVIPLVAEYEQYRQKHGGPASGGLYVNEACARARKFCRKAMELGLLTLDANGNIVKPVQVNLPKDKDTWPDELKTAYQAALKAIKGAIDLAPIWKRQLRLLLDSTDPERKTHPDENDLEVFEGYSEFRETLDLGPLTKTETKQDATSTNTEVDSKNDPTKNIGTANVDPRKKPTSTEEGSAD